MDKLCILYLSPALLEDNKVLEFQGGRAFGYHVVYYSAGCRNDLRILPAKWEAGLPGRLPMAQS